VGNYGVSNRVVNDELTRVFERVALARDRAHKTELLFPTYSTYSTAHAERGDPPEPKAPGKRAD